MATDILTVNGPIDLSVEGTYYSDELENIVDIDIQAVFSAGATARGKCTVTRKTANGAYRVAKDTDNNPLTFPLNGEIPDGINITGLNARYLQVKIEIYAGGAGTLNLEYESI